MKPSEIRDMNDDALFEKGAELREQLFRLRFKHALGNLDTVKSIKDARKDLARVKTELRARELKAGEESGARAATRGSRYDRKRKTASRQRAASRS